MVLKYGPSGIGISTIMTDDGFMELDPYLLFINSIRSEQTRRKYQGRLNIFFDFIALPKGSQAERCKFLLINVRKIPIIH